MSLAKLFIDLKPGENVFSLLSRAHILSGSSSALLTLKRYTAHRGYVPLSDLPTNLLNIKDSLGLNISVEDVIAKHTLFELYKPFLNAQRQSYVKEGMKYTGAVKSRVGLLKSHCGACNQLAYCEECIKGDISNIGFPYWRREHMIRGVNICSIHKKPLKVINTEFTELGIRNLQIPSPNIGKQVKVDEKNFEKFHYLSCQVESLIHMGLGETFKFDSYIRLLNEHNLTTKYNHVRIRDLEIIVENWLRPLKYLSPFDNLFYALEVERSWVANLVNGKESMHHPLKHFILWGALNCDISQILTVVNQKTIQLDLPLTRKRKIEIEKDKIVDLLKQFSSITKVSKILGCSVTTLIVLMNKYGILYKGKPKKITNETLKRVKELVLSGAKTKDIAKKLKISICSVNRIKRAINA